MGSVGRGGRGGRGRRGERGGRGGSGEIRGGRNTASDFSLNECHFLSPHLSPKRHRKL